MPSNRKPFSESKNPILLVAAVDVVALLGFVMTSGSDVQRWNRLVLVHLVVFSLATLALFGLDKWRAKRDRRRVSRANLLLLSAIGGATGGLLGMFVFRHKSRRLLFRIVIPLAFVLHLIVFGYLFFEDI